jgi:hypothetical protein
MRSTPTKSCAKCGRTVTWRKKWARDWEQVRYCSQRCRTERLREADETLEAEILRLVERRSGKTICPSEAARATDPERWRELMEAARQAARRLVSKGAVVITQGGRVVDGSTAKGPFRIRRA